MACKEGGFTRVSLLHRVSKQQHDLLKQLQIKQTLLFLLVSVWCIYFVVNYFSFSLFYFIFFWTDDEDERNSYRSFDNGRSDFLFVLFYFSRYCISNILEELARNVLKSFQLFISNLPEHKELWINIRRLAKNKL